MVYEEVTHSTTNNDYRKRKMKDKCIKEEMLLVPNPINNNLVTQIERASKTLDNLINYSLLLKIMNYAPNEAQYSRKMSINTNANR